MPQTGAPAQRRKDERSAYVPQLGVRGSGQGMVALRRSWQLGTAGPPVGRYRQGVQWLRPRSVSRSNPFPLAFSQDRFYEAGASLRYVRRWVANTFGPRNDPGQTSYNPEALKTESGGKAKDVPVSRFFDKMTLARTFGQYRQSFPNGGYVKMSSGNRYFPEILQLQAKQYTPWVSWARRDQVPIMTQVQVQQTQPWMPSLTGQSPTSSLSQWAVTLPNVPSWIESTYGY